MRAIYIVMILALAISSATAGKPKPQAKAAKDKPKPPAKAVEAAPEKPAGEAVKKAPAKVTHDAIGAKVKASSTNKDSDGESKPSALVDGDLATRWSSAYSAPQRITIELKKEIAIDKIKLHWEAAFATKYRILISQDGEGWTPAHFFFRMGEKKDARVDTCDMKDMKAKHIMVELTERVNDEWGFSLFEIEVLAAKPATP